MALTLATRDVPGATVLDVTGDIDVQTAAQLRIALDELSAANAAGMVVVDLGGTDFIDSSALGVLVGANKRLEAAGHGFAVVTDKPHLLKVFQITRLIDVMRIVPSVAAALA